MSWEDNDPRTLALCFLFGLLIVLFFVVILYFIARFCECVDREIEAARRRTEQQIYPNLDEKIKARWEKTFRKKELEVKTPKLQKGDVERIVRTKTKKKKNKDVLDEGMKTRHKKYMVDKNKADKEAETLSKFKKMGTIHIPKEATDATFLQTCKAPDNVVLEKAYFDENLYEQYDIGTDVDDIELDDDTSRVSSIATNTPYDKSKSENKEKKK